MRDRIERGFEAWGRLLHRRAWWAIGISALAVGSLALQLPDLEVDTSTESFLEHDDQVRLVYDAFREQFGREELIIVVVQPPEIFDLGFLEKLRAFHADLEREVPKLQDVTSLVNARNTRGEADELIVEDLLEDWPETPEELALIRERALSNPLYRDQLFDRQERLTTILIETDAYSSLDQAPADALGGFEEGEAAAPAARRFLTGEENSAIVEAVFAVAERHDAPEFPILVAGSPAMAHYFQQSMLRNMALFGALSLLVIGLLLAVLFRRVVGVVLPLLVSVLSVVATLGFMSALGFSIMIPQQILPSFLLAVGVGGSVHILVIFFQRLESGADREQAIALTLGHSGLPVLMCSATTAGGLASFVTAELAPIAQLGLTAPVGVGFSLLLTLVLAPALLAVCPLRPKRSEGTAGLRARRALVRCGDFARAHARPVVLVSAGIMALSGLGAAQLRFAHNPLEWFPADNPFRVSAELLNARMGGSMFLEVLIDSGQENGLHQPDLLNRIDELRLRASSLQRGDMRVGKSVSIVDLLKEIHQALNENRREFHAIPQDRPLVAQELLLFENSGSDDLENLVDSQFRRARFTLKMPFVDAVQYPPFMQTFEAEAERILGGAVRFEVTGLMAIMGRTFTAVIHSMARSYVLALLVIVPMMVLLIGNLRLGLLSMLPNLMPILMALGVMGWMGLPLDAFTLMIGSIALGLAVDDTIHFMHNFRRYLDRTGDVAMAVRETFSTTGQAMLFTSLVLASGFFIYAFADLANLVRFGWLTGFTIVVAFLADLLLSPALVTLAMGRRRAAAPERARFGEEIS